MMVLHNILIALPIILTIITLTFILGVYLGQPLRNFFKQWYQDLLQPRYLKRIGPPNQVMVHYDKQND